MIIHEQVKGIIYIITTLLIGLAVNIIYSNPWIWAVIIFGASVQIVLVFIPSVEVKHYRRDRICLKSCHKH